MRICNTNHADAAYEGSQCPVCELISEIADLKDKLIDEMRENSDLRYKAKSENDALVRLKGVYKLFLKERDNPHLVGLQRYSELQRRVLDILYVVEEVINEDNKS